ncbi:MAG TPA: gliding motility-associated C-terminal domain-containing protein, partial [Algoriphagus sp.]|nr:gliding motility-associated C-terminal domain-containing protein [Algoriphagus sp.]
NYSPDSVEYSWRDPSGILVSSTANLITSNYGTYSLEVQPKGSIPCQIEPFNFEIPVPVLSVETNIIAQPLCPDQPNASLTVEADLSEISTIEWWYTDFNNSRIRLLSESNKEEILATNEGTYEVILKNQFDCFMGSDQVLVLRSSDQVRPIVEESYQICPRYEIAPVINPGSFAGYEWYFGDNLVSTSPTFKPFQIGTYRLVVFSTEGCAYETTFETLEECELRVNFPNAIQPGNPDKPFLIYTNYLIDELEIWIFSKWGEVIFHCKNTQLLTEESTCIWDGYFDGQKVPPGSYAYRINFKNLEKNISNEQLGSILVIN